jgi:hypothetical protein
VKLCVGAVSRRIVEEAAKLKVHQIVASRRQVNVHGGYTGMDQIDIVRIVRDLSDGETQVVRDHGGPYQNGDEYDDWVEELDLDVRAGFDTLHLDVSKLADNQQRDELVRLVDRYRDKVYIEIGGERDGQPWLSSLVRLVVSDMGVIPLYAVADVGGHIWADRQRGYFKHPDWVRDMARGYHDLGVGIKAHNCDWSDAWRPMDLDAVNIAPEFGNVELDAWLRYLDGRDVHALLSFAYDTGSWHRWFRADEGTRFEKARAALRYHLNDEFVVDILHHAGADGDGYVREAIRDAIVSR